MRIISYVISTGMDVDTLPDALNSLVYFSDHIYVVDGLQGRGTLAHYVLYAPPIREWLKTRDEYEESSKWRGVPFTLWEREFLDPASQRNFALARIAEVDTDADWVCWIDSDEVCSWEMIKETRGFLGRMPDDVMGVTQKWLNLVQDYNHCVGGQHSTWLAHPRIHRVHDVAFSGAWHESMVIDRSKVIRHDVRIIHTRAIFRKRLLVQRGHPVIRGKSNVMPDAPMFWDDAILEEIPPNVTWPELHPPAGEILPFPFEADAAKVWDYKTGERIGSLEDNP